MRLNDLHRSQRGATMIEVLIAVLVLSFGLLGLSSMFAHAVMSARLSGHRLAAVHIASAHVDKIRANAAGFHDGDYAKPLSYDGTFNPVGTRSCAYPACGPADLAAMDSAETDALARRELPAGGMLTTCDPAPCQPGSMGNVWIVWQEPRTLGPLQPASTDLCPEAVTTRFDNPRPRCLYLRFRP